MQTINLWYTHKQKEGVVISITIKDVAKASGFSVATVSRALNKDSAVKLDTRRQITQVASRLGYNKVALDEPVDTQRTKTVGLIVPDILNPYFATMSSALSEYFRYSDYALFIVSNDRTVDEEVRLAERLLAQNVDGLVVAPNSIESIDRILNLVNDMVPLTFFTATNRGYCHSRGINSVCIDDENAAYNATKYLLSLGHEQVYYLGGNQASLSVMEKVSGFQKALQEFGRPCSEHQIYYSNFNNTDIKFKITQMVECDNLPSAFLTANDYVAVFAIAALAEHGIRVPEDISIIGFDNIDLSSHPSINLTTMNQPKYEIARAVTDLLISEIQLGVRKEKQQIVLGSSLIIRNSCQLKIK